MWKQALFAGLLLGGTLPVMASTADTVKAQVETLRAEPITVYATYPGTVVPSEYVQIASRMSGYVKTLEVDVGQHVKKGDLLLTVNPIEVDAGVEQARSQLAKAKAALATARQNYRRFKALFAQKAIPRQSFEKVELAYHAAQSDYQAAQAGVQKATDQIGYSQVRAPFDGVVFSKTISNGQLVGPGKELMVLYNPKQLQTEVEVDDAAYYRLKLGAKVPVEYAGVDQRPHRVEAVTENLVAAANPTTHTHTVKLLLPPESQAQGGEYARVMIPVRQESAILVPASALQVRAGITGVFVENRQGDAEFHMVTVGEQRGGRVVILSGLFPGDRLIVRADGDLANGVKVQAEGADS